MTGELKIHAAKARHLTARNAMIAALAPFDDLSTMELLAVAAQLVGSLIAFQDLTPEQTMELVSLNIAEGNAIAIRETLGNPKGAACPDYPQ